MVHLMHRSRRPWQSQPHAPRKLRFGVYEVDFAGGELRKQGLRLRLQEQPFQVLAALLERPGEVIAREDLIRRLWPDGTVVDYDRGLNAAVTRLRQVLWIRPRPQNISRRSPSADTGSLPPSMSSKTASPRRCRPHDQEIFGEFGWSPP